MPSDDANFEAVDLPGLQFSLLFSHTIILYITNSYICSSGNPRAAKKKVLETMQKSIQSLRIMFMANERFKLNISLVSE